MGGKQNYVETPSITRPKTRRRAVTERAKPYRHYSIVYTTEGCQQKVCSLGVSSAGTTLLVVPAVPGRFPPTNVRCLTSTQEPTFSGTGYRRPLQL